MKAWRDDVPDWQDQGKRAQLLLDDGSTTSGTLYVEDAYWNGCDDEIPIFHIKLDDGGDMAVVGEHQWRLT